MENRVIDASTTVTPMESPKESIEESKKNVAALPEESHEEKNILGERNAQRSKKAPLSLRKIMEENKRVTPPNPVKVPPKKFFGYPERYMSPTDSIMSPVSRGLLARNRRIMRPVPAFVPPKVLDKTFQDVEPPNLEAP